MSTPTPTEACAPRRIDLPGADLCLPPRVALADADALLSRLISHVPWRQEHITLFGVTRPQPRLVAWYGDPGASYTYSGIRHEPLPWTRDLARLRDTMAGLCACSFNSVLLNYYRDGKDSMGLHADDERELGADPVIASLSLGATRRMYFRHKTRRDLPTHSIDLPHCSALIMRGDTQACWKHGLRRTARPCGPRVNLTFRQILPLS